MICDTKLQKKYWFFNQNNKNNIFVIQFMQKKYIYNTIYAQKIWFAIQKFKINMFFIQNNQKNIIDDKNKSPFFRKFSKQPIFFEILFRFLDKITVKNEYFFVNDAISYC
jgi:hypothetical protein